MELTVQTPCQQRWSEMVPNQKGRFCGSCQNTVVDFTAMTDQQLVAYFQDLRQSVCGRFRTEQLNRELAGNRTFETGAVRQRWVSLVAAGLLSWSAAQGRPTNENVLKTEPIAFDFRVKKPIIPTQTASAPDSVRTVSGRIIGKDGSAIPGVSIYVKGTQYGTNTDNDGHFSINLIDSQSDVFVLVFSGIGYVQQEITRKTADLLPITVALAEDTTVLGGVVTVGYPVVKKPTLLQKIKRRFR